MQKVESSKGIALGGLYQDRLGSGYNGSNNYKGSAHSEYPSPRNSPKPLSTSVQEGLKGDKEHLVDHLKSDMISMKKKIDFLQSLFNKQTDYFDDHMYKMSVKLESVANLEKRM
jgi:hypothetical protein